LGFFWLTIKMFILRKFSPFIVDNVHTPRFPIDHTFWGVIIWLMLDRKNLSTEHFTDVNHPLLPNPTQKR
jgi:hypothetical protein